MKVGRTFLVVDLANDAIKMICEEENGDVLKLICLRIIEKALYNGLNDSQICCIY